MENLHSIFRMRKSSSAKVVARRGIQILIRLQDGSVERSIFMCRPNISFRELFQEVRLKRLKKYVCCAVHVTGKLNMDRRIRIINN